MLKAKGEDIMDYQSFLVPLLSVKKFGWKAGDQKQVLAQWSSHLVEAFLHVRRIARELRAEELQVFEV